MCKGTLIILCCCLLSINSIHIVSNNEYKEIKIMTKSYCLYQSAIILNVVQSLSHVQLFGMPWTAALQASLSFTISRSLLRFMSIESVMLSNHFILCRSLHILPSIFPSIRVFSNELAFHLRGQSIGVSASASVLPMNIQS